MATAEADAAVLALLAGITSPVALTTNVNLFLGPALGPDDTRPQKSVFVTATGGPRNDRLCGTTHDYRILTVQVIVRADPSDYDGGQALARACRDAIHCATISGYVDAGVREPDPYYLRTDEDGRHLWTMNVNLTRIT